MLFSQKSCVLVRENGASDPDGGQRWAAVKGIISGVRALSTKAPIMQYWRGLRPRDDDASWPSRGLMGAHRAHHPGRFLSPTRGKQGFPQRFQGPGSMWPHRKKILTNQNALFRSISHQPCPRVGVLTLSSSRCHVMQRHVM